MMLASHRRALGVTAMWTATLIESACVPRPSHVEAAPMRFIESTPRPKDTAAVPKPLATNLATLGVACGNGKCPATKPSCCIRVVDGTDGGATAAHVECVAQAKDCPTETDVLVECFHGGDCSKGESCCVGHDSRRCLAACEDDHLGHGCVKASHCPGANTPAVYNECIIEGHAFLPQAGFCVRRRVAVVPPPARARRRSRYFFGPPHRGE